MHNLRMYLWRSVVIEDDRFSPGDEARVIRDGRMDHGVPLNEIVELLRWDGGDSTWYTNHQGSHQWVAIEDIVPIEPEVTEDEILQLFGMKFQPHCTTCTCSET